MAVTFLITFYKDEIETRYKQLRDKGIFSADNIVGLLKKWLDMIGYDNLEKEFSVYDETPSYRSGYINEGWECVNYNDWSSADAYNEQKQYTIGDKCSYNGYVFKATKEINGIPPIFDTYTKTPNVVGFYNSPQRVYNWLQERITNLDKLFNYQ